MAPLFFINPTSPTSLPLKPIRLTISQTHIGSCIYVVRHHYKPRNQRLVSSPCQISPTRLTPRPRTRPLATQEEPHTPSPPSQIPREPLFTQHLNRLVSQLFRRLHDCQLKPQADSKLKERMGHEGSRM